nr:MAG TPA: hypothetical protein [Caudoviricetes sp.]
MPIHTTPCIVVDIKGQALEDKPQNGGKQK